MRRWREYDCEDCGTPTRRQRHGDDPMVCLDCGLERAKAAAREMANKSGPAWDRYTMNPNSAGGMFSRP